MGYMTTITVLNDEFSQIKANPKEFVDKICEGMRGYRRSLNSIEISNVNSFGIGNHCNNVIVAKSNHADDPRMFITYQNSMDIIGWGNDSKHLEYRKRLLKIAKKMIEYEEQQIKKLEGQS
ncbi:hypothetical protein F4V43_01885 [Paenibacillus spiritus]|uniref:Uncharacterized protein n=1 Tax=Paenibacillus spiritus TaxID=2496557 RepID=A0A5J5GGI4_9BACL|nr:hypothetical protein [Paenibacillus spiritus]KAA9007261.1 hypothetical protein F4V43_01885 [Paenibacillus spiritus]